jgi:hypothetical protein
MDCLGVRLSARLIGVVIGIGLGAAVASARTAAPAAASPQLMSLAYGQFAEPGTAHPAPGLRLKDREPRGQVVEVAFQELRKGIANGVGGAIGERCGSHGRRNGRVDVTYLPLSQSLSRGTHEIRVVAYGSRCAKGSPVASSVRTFRVHVRH